MEKLPIIFAVDDDPQVLRAITRDLKRKYKKEFRVIGSSSPQEALEALVELRNRDEVIAMLVSDQRMPVMLGVDYLEQAREVYPKAKRVLLTAYSDTDAAIKAINEVNLDYYLMKPWDPPEEKMYPVLDDLLDDWQGAYVPPMPGIKVLGFQWSPKSHQIKDFLSGNLIPYHWMDYQSDPAAAGLLEINGLGIPDLPVIFFEDGSFLQDPQLSEIGSKVGFSQSASETLYDVTIIGAGPSGLAAAVYGASEGLKTLLVEKRAPGGQAGTSSRIENYLGFPSGLSGAELSRRAITQATRFGTEFLAPQSVEAIEIKNHYKILTLGDGSKVHTRAVIIATGVEYRQLEAPGISDFTGKGVYYGAATTEANAVKDKDVYVVGGGNSAGQGAMYLSNFARNVYIVIRREDLTSSMSSYLIDQIDGTDNIHLIPHTEVVQAIGSDRLDQLVLHNRQSGEDRTVDACALFIFIGARPHTDWLGEGLIRDEKGFIPTGRDLMSLEHFKKVWKLEREPYLLETCVPGVFASGDVRAGAMNRVASAVGEGSMSIKFTHQYLATI